MGDFKDNPKEPFEIKVPNKIRKRIAMHEKSKPKPLVRKIKPIQTEQPKKRGSMWSRFVNKVKNFLE